LLNKTVADRVSCQYISVEYVSVRDVSFSIKKPNNFSYSSPLFLKLKQENIDT